MDKQKEFSRVLDGFDIELIEDNLGISFDGVSPLRKGHLNSKFSLSAGPDHFVLKIYSDSFAFISPKLSSSARARAEYEALMVCRSNGLAAPTPIWLSQNALLMSHVQGTPVKDLPITKEILTDILSWLKRFYSIQVSNPLLNIGVPDLPFVAARKHIARYVSNNPDDALVRELEQMLLSLHWISSDQKTLTHGDPTLGNWLLFDHELSAVDFEFFTAGFPLFDSGLLIASVLDHGEFSHGAFEKSEYVIRNFMQNFVSESYNDLPNAILCGLVLIAVSVPDSERRQRIFRHIKSTMEWAPIIIGAKLKGQQHG
ncbi:MAG TPA: aminoglycoside phosphotransferase family protein [Bacteroidota bacterium]|nr:aminoglycoside phosphotransferase family protein [Bacteroidota bacterium]